ncbi:MAG: DNA-3-methyladenine glycosylase 2 family protein [Myxococcota bacterium]|nr:DNA-3-methyladenine glycosylase 2 family protein [Myxococcota bacterium]
MEGALDLRRSVGAWALGPRDPTLRARAREAVLASDTPEGPATLAARLAAPGRLEARAWGPGAAWILARAGAVLGTDDAPPEPPARLRPFADRAPGLRLARAPRLVGLLARLVLQQKVSGKEAARGWCSLVAHFAPAAPGPFPALRLPLGAESLARIPMAAFPALGILARQGGALRSLAARAARIEEAASLPHAEAARRLRSLPGLGPWTVGSALLLGMGCADAVPLGDLHLPGLVGFALAGEPHADDARMLELLAPFTGQRGRAVRWILAGAALPPRRGPRHPLRPVRGRAAVARLARRDA